MDQRPALFTAPTCELRSLRRKGHGSIALTCLALFLLAARSPAAPLRISLRVQTTPTVSSADLPPSQARLRVSAAAGENGGERPQAVEVSVPVPGQHVLEVAPGPIQVTVHTEQFWSTPQHTTLGSEGGDVRLDLWPTAEISGRLRPPNGEAMPPQVALRFSPATGGAPVAKEPQGKLSCPVAEGRFRCHVPAGKMDLRLRAAGFVTHYRWGLSLGLGKPADLGTFALERGASVVGWVGTAGGEPLPKEVAVSLLPAGLATPTRPEEGAQTQLVVERVTPRANGFFSFDGIPPGTYQVEARAASYAPAAEAVPVLANRESELRDPLLLAPPVPFSLVVDPPMDPDGNPWRLTIGRLSRYQGSLTERREAVIAEHGWWEGAGFSPGTHLVRIARQGGDAVLSREVVIGEEPLPIQLDIPLVKVLGSLQLGREPLAATIWFGGRRGAVKVETASDDEGHFELLLPNPGRWLVEVAAETPRIRRKLVGVSVPEPRGSAQVEVALRLPATRVRGRVVTEDGTPPQVAVVFAQAEEEHGASEVSVQAEENGDFELVGLPEGEVALKAESRGMESDFLQLSLQEEREPAPVELVLRAQMEVRGLLMGPDHPVPGGQLTLFPVQQPGYAAPPIRSDAQGEFTCKLPAGTREVFATYGAPGYGLEVSRVAVAAGQTLILSLGRAAGDLLLAMPENSRELFEVGAPFLLRDGVRLLPFWIQSWRALHPSPAAESSTSGLFRIPNLAPGNYQLCNVAVPEAGKLDSSGETEQCLSGYLATNAALFLGGTDESGDDEVR